MPFWRITPSQQSPRNPSSTPLTERERLLSKMPFWRITPSQQSLRDLPSIPWTERERLLSTVIGGNAFFGGLLHLGSLPKILHQCPEQKGKVTLKNNWCQAGALLLLPYCLAEILPHLPPTARETFTLKGNPSHCPSWPPVSLPAVCRRTVPPFTERERLLLEVIGGYFIYCMKCCGSGSGIGCFLTPGSGIRDPE